MRGMSILPRSWFGWCLVILFGNLALIGGLIAFHNFRAKRNTYTIFWDTSYRVHGSGGKPTVRHRWKELPDPDLAAPHNPNSTINEPRLLEPDTGWLLRQSRRDRLPK
jgi:hypothetical protein